MRRKFLGAVWLVLATGLMLAGVGLAYGTANAVAQSPEKSGLHVLMVVGAVALDVVILLIVLFLVTRLADFLL